MSEFNEHTRVGMEFLVARAPDPDVWPDRIVSFNLSDDRRFLRVQEECDEFYSLDLVSPEVDALVAFLQGLRSQMVETL